MRVIMRIFRLMTVVVVMTSLPLAWLGCGDDESTGGSTTGGGMGGEGGEGGIGGTGGTGGAGGSDCLPAGTTCPVPADQCKPLCCSGMITEGGFASSSGSGMQVAECL